jgi:hypothetical protein
MYSEMLPCGQHDIDLSAMLRTRSAHFAELNLQSAIYNLQSRYPARTYRRLTRIYTSTNTLISAAISTAIAIAWGRAFRSTSA